MNDFYLTSLLPKLCDTALKNMCLFWIVPYKQSFWNVYMAYERIT